MSIRHLAGRFLLMVALLAGCAGPSESSTDSSVSTVDQTDSSSDQEPAGLETDQDAEPQDSEPQDAESQETGGTQLPGEGDEIVRTDDGETRNDQFVSPVFEALGFDPNDRRAARAEYVAKAEELVRECMAEAGFDYLADVLVYGPAIGRQLELSETISAEQFTAEYGYGIMTLLTLDYQEGGVVGFVELLFGPASDEARSAGERTAYEVALSGTSLEGLNAQQTRNQAWRNAFEPLDGSCRAYGYDSATNPVQDKYDGLTSLLGDQYEELPERVDADPRIADLLSDWQACMAGHGYAYEHPDDIRDELFQADSDLRGRFGNSAEVLRLFATSTEDRLPYMNADDRFDWLESNGAFNGFSMVPGLQAQHDELITFELTVAAHDADCYDAETYFEVLLEYELAFVEEHGPQLALIAANET